MKKGQLRQLVSVLPQNNESDLSYDVCEDDLNRAVSGIEALSDKAEMLRAISDNGLFVEVKKAHATEMVTGFIRLNALRLSVMARSKQAAYLTEK